MIRIACVFLVVVVVLGACERGKEQPAAAGVPEGAGAATNRVDIPATVRQNLGITFATVESRVVGGTIRVPGRFELAPTAMREYRVPAAGRVELLVAPYERIEAGQPLYRLDAPRWRELQKELTEAEVGVRLAEAASDSIAPFMDAHEKHHSEIQAAVDLWGERVAALERLREAGGASGEQLAQGRAMLAASRASLAETLEKEAELAARARDVAAQLAAARARESILLESAASLTGHSSKELIETIGGGPRWRAIARIEVRAAARGVVESLLAIEGTYVEEHAAVMTTVRPEQVRFRASGLQSDLGRLKDGAAATVVAPLGGTLADAEPIGGTLRLAPVADSARRTIELVMMPSADRTLPSWARPGVSAFLEVVVAGTTGEELAIPLACVVRDGTQRVIFRRDPADPDKVIRMEADLGVDDGRWVVIRSGVAEGNQIVLDGVYQLMIATSGSMAKGGHFHSDGTFHEDGK